MKSSFMLVHDAARWRLTRTTGQQVDVREVPAGEGADAAEVKAALDDWGYAGDGVCLALPSSMVLSARIDCQGLPRGSRRTAMVYRMEEQLPLDVEALTADFLPPVDGTVLGVAAESQKVKEQIDVLSAAGIEVVAVCPLALLALWSERAAGQSADYAILAEPDNIDVFRLNANTPTGWHTIENNDKDLVECLNVDQLSRPVGPGAPTAVIVAEAAWSAAQTESSLGLTAIGRSNESVLTAAAKAAAKLLSGVPAAGWVDLRRDALAVSNPWAQVRGLVRYATVVGLLLPAVLAGVFCWRGLQYASAAQHQHGRQTAVYRQLYPNRNPPANVVTRLTSDLRLVAGTSGATQDMPRRASALETLRLASTGLPSTVRLRILQMNISPTELYIQGQSSSHTDAEVISLGLASQGLAMDPPRTEVLAPDEVAFTLSGRVEASPGLPAGSRLPGQGPDAPPDSSEPTVVEEPPPAGEAAPQSNPTESQESQK